jgi:L-seryl-tRNA(Ser) seleniumtransferase
VYAPQYPGAHPVPYLRVKWDRAVIPVSYEECAKQLREGEPRIEVNASADELTLASYLLSPGEERITGWRLAEVLTAASRA